MRSQSSHALYRPALLRILNVRSKLALCNGALRHTFLSIAHSPSPSCLPSTYTLHSSLPPPFSAPPHDHILRSYFTALSQKLSISLIAPIAPIAPCVRSRRRSLPHYPTQSQIQTPLELPLNSPTPWNTMNKTSHSLPSPHQALPPAPSHRFPSLP